MLGYSEQSHAISFEWFPLFFVAEQQAVFNIGNAFDGHTVMVSNDIYYGHYGRKETRLK